MRPLSSRLVEVVRVLAPPHSVADVAPATRRELGIQSVGGLVVWSGASAGTIHGDPRNNWSFRAWHDSIHLVAGLDFSIEHEVEIGWRQACEAARLAGDLCADLVWLEVAGQALHHQRTGQFIDNQVEWTLRQLARNNKRGRSA